MSFADTYFEVDRESEVKSSSLAQRVRELDRVDTATLMTLILLIIAGPSDWYAKIPITTMAVAGLLYRPLRNGAVFWSFVTTLVLTSNFFNYYTADNHKHLMGIWCLGVCLSTYVQDRERFLSAVARSLLGVSFLLAVIWKLVADDFMTGDVMRFELLFDDRFSTVANWIAQVRVDDLEANRKAHALLMNGEIRAGVQATLSYSGGVDLVARGMTWWTIAIEGAVALTFLWPGERGPASLRDLPLLAFLATTYPVATVVGFGYTLAILGISQSVRRAPWVTVAYAALFIVIFAFQIPVGDMASAVLDGSKR
jgi:hypothetical protein